MGSVFYSAAAALLCLWMCGASSAAQTGTTSGSNVPTAPIGSSPSVNDYVACVFTPDQLATFRVMPATKVLNAKLAEKTIDAAMFAVDALINNGTLKQDVGSKLKADLQATDLIGMDAKEVQTAIGATLNKSLATAPVGAQEAASSAVKTATGEVSAVSFSAPSDVACSISPLTYKETNQIFGLSIAKNYVAFQVVARNLNADKEFQLHSVELAVDTDPCGTKEQFDAGRDRLLVRAMAIRNQSTDPRNFAVRVMEGISTIAGTAVGFTPVDYARGLAVFSSLIPAGKAIFPDYTVDQLNRISDLTFASSGQTRTVVPKNGVAMFVTFIPSQPLEQSWWVGGATQTPGGGPASQACTLARGAHPTNKKPWVPGNPKPIAYKNWKSDALLEFRRHSFVIVAGVHTTGDDALLPVIDAVDCQNGAKVLDLGRDKPKSEAPSTVTCTLKGKNLEKVVTLELQNAKSAADSLVADAPVTVKQGNPSSATALFQGDDLRALNGTTYNVLWINNQKLPTASEQTISVQPYPLVTSADKQLQTPVKSAGVLSLKGIHLTMAGEVNLTCDKTDAGCDKAVVSFKVDPTKATSTELNLPYTPSTFKDKPAGKYAVTVLVDGKVVTGASDAIIELTAAPK